MLMKTTRRLFLGLLTAAGLSACSVQTTALYDTPSAADTLAHIGNFYGLDIWQDYLNSEVWYTPDSACLQVRNVFDNTAQGNGALLVTWNKQAEGCTWVGLGVGWDAWASKNVRDIYHQAAIQFMVRSLKGTLNGLPWAMALEDYNGGQAWAGVFSSFIEGNKITEDWTRVQVPLSAFDTELLGADLTMVKQLLIQFEADGSVYLDDIKLVPLEGGFTKQAEVTYLSGTSDYMPAVEGNPTLSTDNANVWLFFSGTNLFVQATVADATPLMNMQEGKDIWNGDALEIAFSTNPDAKAQRKAYLLTDQHIAIRASNNPIIWDLRKDRQLMGDVTVEPTPDGYRLKAIIPLAELRALPLVSGKTYGLEVAVDDGDSSGSRIFQYRWNNPGNEGFHTSPAMWGTMELMSPVTLMMEAE